MQTGVDNNYNTDNTYTRFKGFPLAGIWQEKLQIIVIIDIKETVNKIVGSSRFLRGLKSN